MNPPLLVSVNVPCAGPLIKVACRFVPNTSMSLVKTPGAPILKVVFSFAL